MRQMREEGKSEQVNRDAGRYVCPANEVLSTVAMMWEL